MKISKATAVCQQCKKENITTELDGEIILTPYPTGVYINNAKVRGLLLFLCASHHDSKRNLQDRSLPQHNKFDVLIEGRLIGEMGATTQAQEVDFAIKDAEIRRTIMLEKRASSKESLL